MNYDDLDIEELEELLENRVTEVDDLKNALEHIEKAINDIGEIDYDGMQEAYEDLLQSKKEIEDIKKFIELDMEEIADQIATLEEWQDDDPNERYREYRDMQGF